MARIFIFSSIWVLFFVTSENLTCHSPFSTSWELTVFFTILSTLFLLYHEIPEQKSSSSTSPYHTKIWAVIHPLNEHYLKNYCYLRSYLCRVYVRIQWHNDRIRKLIKNKDSWMNKVVNEQRKWYRKKEEYS